MVDKIQNKQQKEEKKEKEESIFSKTFSNFNRFFYEFFYQWFSPSNILAFFLISLILGNVFLKSTETVNPNLNQFKNQIGRIVAVENGQFGEFKTYFSTDYGILRGSLFEKPPLGKQVKFKGDLITFDFSEKTTKFDQYEKSLGIIGAVDNLWITEIQTNCDLTCLLIKQTQTAKEYVNQYYQKIACKDYLFVSKIINSSLPCQNVAGLSVGLVTGGTSGFTDEMKDGFRTLGLSHLVAVSGFQVVLVMTTVEAFFVKLKLKRQHRFFLAILAILAMILLVGPQPPVLRSSISIILSQSVLLFLGRRVFGLRLLIYSGLIMLLINPFYLFSASFQLSFLASTGMIASSGQDLHPLPFNIHTFFKDVVLTSCFTFLYTLPVIVGLFGKISLASIFSNILLIPLIPWITFSNLFGLIPLFGEIFMIPVVAVQTFILSLIQLASTSSFFQFFVIKITAFSWWEIILYYLILFTIPKLFSFLVSKNLSAKV